MNVNVAIGAMEIPAAPAVGPFTPPCMNLLDYWRTLPREAGGIPRRADFDPARIRRLLPHMSIMQLDGGELKIRLAGTAFRERSGTELTGLIYRDLVTPENHARTVALVGCMFTQPCGTWHIHPEEFDDRLRYEVEALSLPLIGDTPETRLIVSVTVVLGPDLRMETRPAPKKPTRMFTATRFSFIDIGAGIPNIA